MGRKITFAFGAAINEPDSYREAPTAPVFVKQICFFTGGLKVQLLQTAPVLKGVSLLLLLVVAVVVVNAVPISVERAAFTSHF